MEAQLTAAATPLIQAALSAVTLLDLASYWPEQADVKDGDSFDFIIVGGGTAGCIIANRLTEIEDFNVLVLEAGGDPPIESVLPGLFPLLAKSEHDWNFTSTNDHYTGQHLQGKVMALSAGKMLGGSSSMDHQFYVRGNPKDFEAWVDSTGDESWGWNNLLYYFKKIEHVTAQDIIKSKYVNFRGTNGYLKLEKEPYDVVKEYLDAFNEIGHDIVIDTDGDHLLGYTEALFTNYDNKRHSNAYAYLRPVRDRKNLEVLKHALVTKIIIKNNIAVGVELKLEDGNAISVKANREVILTAGTFNSAKLLMLSGVGPKEHLKSFGINVISDLPVGFNYLDHPQVQVIYRMAESLEIAAPLDPFHFPEPGFTGYVSLNKSKTQPDYGTLHAHFYHDALVELLLCGISFNTEDEFCQKVFEANTGYNILYTVVSLLHPKSRGRVYLKSADPEDLPIIEVGYLTDKSDLETLARALEDFSRIENSTYFIDQGAKFVEMDLPECKDLQVGSFEYWKCYALAMSSTTYHPSSTCSMGKVVDANLKVKGIQNLRVGDASVIPSTISGNIKSAVNVVAEKLSDIIKIAYNKTTETAKQKKSLITNIL